MRKKKMNMPEAGDKNKHRPRPKKVTKINKKTEEETILM